MVVARKDPRDAGKASGGVADYRGVDVDKTTERPWLKWAYRYGALAVEEFDSFDAAFEAAEWAADDGLESLHCIEGPDGVVPDGVLTRMRKERWERERAHIDEGPKPTHGVSLTAPDGKDWAWYETFTSKAEAEAEAATLRALYGDDRVKIRSLPLRP